MSAETEVKALALTVDPGRERYAGETGIFVRAKGPDGNWGAFDITELDRASLFKWLRGRGGKNVWAENVIFTIFGHKPISEQDEP